LSDQIFIESIYGILRGPLALAAIAVFILGSLYQILRFMRLSKKKDRTALLPSRGVAPDRMPPVSRSAWREFRLRLKETVFGTHPFTLVATTIFHVCFFVVPMFLLAHNVLLEELVGISLCPFVFSERSTDALTVLLLTCALFLLGRRILVRQVRAISTAGDYLTLGLAVAPFVTGLMALHLSFDYTTYIILHMLSAEILLCLLPFTKFVHMIFFFINRLALDGEYSFRAGRRFW
jgi:nitrate reductase gamma subunit